MSSKLSPDISRRSAWVIERGYLTTRNRRCDRAQFSRSYPSVASRCRLSERSAMAQNWLTARLVEELQERIEDGLEIDAIVAVLQGTTLPGLVEYRCLRRTSAVSVPALPEPVMSSVIGRAFAALRPSPHHSNPSGGTSPLRRIDRRPAEFWAIRNANDLQTEEWQAFTIRFARSARGVGLHKVLAVGLRGALQEMADNAVLHAGTDAPTLVGYRVLDGFAQFCVADVGIGVLNSLRSCPDFGGLRFDNEAIKEALRDGVSRLGRNKGGMGFRHVFKALAEQWGILRFRSGEGCITMDGTGLDADATTEESLPRLPGFQVTVSCRAGNCHPSEPLV